VKAFLKKNNRLRFKQGAIGGNPIKKIISVFEDGVNRYVAFDDDTIMAEETLDNMHKNGQVDTVTKE
jgi:hypothetical protein